MKKTLSKVLAVIIAVMLVVSAMPVAFAADGDIASGTAGEGITWVIDADGTLTISGEGAIVVDWYAPPWENYNESIINIVVEEGITKIPSSAFCYATNALTLSIPASVTDMPINTTPFFWGNGLSLEAVNVHEDNPVFASVDGILFSKDKTMLYLYPMNKAGESYTVPETITDINSHAFAFNNTLRRVVIPDTVISMGYDTFYLARVESVEIGSGIKTIPSTCFSSCSYIENITFSDSVETIEGSAFWYCSNLTNMNIGSGIKKIYESAFGGCDDLSAIHYDGTEEQWGMVTIEPDENTYMSNIAIHYATDVVYNEAIDATCTTDGHTAGDYCNACGYYLTGEVTETALGHDYVNGVCQREDCGYICEHINEVFDDKCDECGVEVELEFSEIKLGETKTAYIDDTNNNVYVKYVAKESRELVLTSDNGGDGENIDPYAAVYDEDFNEISFDDDGGENYNFELVFEATAGENYYFVLSTYSLDVQFNYTLDKYVAITHQPTALEPYLELNDDTGAVYQWYTAEFEYAEITSENADIVTNDYGKSSYSTDIGWTGVYYQDDPNGFDYFTLNLKANDTVILEFTDNYIGTVGLYDYNTGNEEYIQAEGDSNILTITVETGGEYTLYTYSENGTMNLKAYLLNTTVTAIPGQTSATLKNPVIGTSYVCGVLVEDMVLVSDIFEYARLITHQPTSAEPYVELNDDTGVSYQWYEAEENTLELTDENVALDDFLGSGILPTYDAENGWTGVALNESSIYFFTLPLKEGESITVTSDGNATLAIIMSLSDTLHLEHQSFDENGTAVLTAPTDGNYFVLTDATTQLKAFVIDYSYTEIEGQTTNTLTEKVIGKNYACEITAGEGLLLSNVFKYSYAIIHQPTISEPYVELNDDTDATYQWYAVEGGYDEITDKDAEPVQNPATSDSSYDTTNGWSGSYWDDGSGADFFSIYLEEGETVDIVINGNATQVAILDYSTLTIVSDVPNPDGTITLTAPIGATYTVSAYCDAGTTIKVYKDKLSYTAIDGETAAELKTSDKGLYVCEVTFADGSTEMSQNLDTNYQPGDADGNGKVNNRDLVRLQQYLADWDVEIIKDCCDVDDDGKVNNRDLVRLQQYLADWDVELL